MLVKNPIWISIVIVMAILGYYNYISWDLVIWFSVIYVFVLGLWVEFDEIKTMEELKSLLDSKIENLEKFISNTTQRIDSEERIKERVLKKRREVIDWLSKF